MPRRRRDRCARAAIDRAVERLRATPDARLEALCRRMLPVYLEAGRTRYILRVHGSGWRAHVVWDLGLDGIVTVSQPTPTGGGRRG